MPIQDFNPASGSNKWPSASSLEHGSDGHRDAKAGRNGFAIQVPAVNLPKGGGALKNIDEKFQVNPSNGTASFSISLPFSRMRSDFGPAISLGYDSGSGNGSFGLGWSLDLPSIQRKTSQQLPFYEDGRESDIFMFSGMEDLTPMLQQDDPGHWKPVEFTAPSGETVKRYRPRIEKDFQRIERVTPPGSSSFYWIVTSPNNIVTVYGRTDATRISDPSDTDRVFKWLPELSFDDKGNCMEFEYLNENLINVFPCLHEQNRLKALAPFTNTYLKRVKYGNTVPYSFDVSLAYHPAPPVNPGYLFEAVFDFGDHELHNPSPSVQQSWPARPDAFSTYSSCFEIRTYRLCERILFFHYFKELNDGETALPYLVRSLDIQYRYFHNPVATPEDISSAETNYIISVQQSGYKKVNGVPVKKSLPPLEFDYQAKGWDTTVKTVSPENRENAPAGITGTYQWLDLWDEGISGILSEQGHGWFYKSNLGNGNFSPGRPVIHRPSLAGLAAGSLQVQDLEADGRKFMVSLSGSIKGYFELQHDHEWETFRSFDRLPDIDLKDANTRFLDLDGDGKPEIVISGENIFTWYASKGKQGYDDARISPKPFDEERGPAIVFNDPTESIFLADMSGDGLTDIVRVRNGDICYWPNLGYGKFGARVNMDFSPVFDPPDLFDPSLLRLADISGTGATDILYIGADGCMAWINLSGNAWSKAVPIGSFPSTVLADRVSVVDFTGNGTACLVWSSALPSHEDAPLRYIDLMGGKKPFLLSGYKNSFGKEVNWEYLSSTTYYLADKLAGTPWITRLPFPVHCVSKVMINDQVAGTYFTNSYTYHHGYYDHPEKEFRGFGRVEQTDTEDFENFSLSGSGNVTEKDLHQAPVTTITWYHTGAFIGKTSLLHQYEKEYNRGVYEFDLPSSLLPEGMSPAEYREAVRACKGMILRQEIYARDGDARDSNPYTVSASNYMVKSLQPRMKRHHAVFLTQESETAEFYYERNMTDPRAGHSFILERDDFGHILKSATVAYGRKTADASLPASVQQEQATLHVIFTVDSYTHAFDQADAYRIPLKAETKIYELTGINSANGKSFQPAELLNAFLGAAEIGFEVSPNHVSPQKRLIEDEQTIYLANDLITALPSQQMDTMGLVGQSYRLAFTPSLISFLAGSRITVSMLSAASYAQPDSSNWWIPSGTDIYLQAAETVHDAQERFYLPVMIKDASGKVTKLVYDNYSLLLVQTEDALSNKVTVDTVDYRVLQPAKLKDANDNVSEVITDELGMVLATSVYGTENDGMHGDSPLSGYQIITPVNAQEVAGNPQKFLQQATTFFYYDLFAWTNDLLPACFISVVRETHVSELTEGQSSRVFLSVGYANGMGSVLQMKTQAEPGIALQWQGSAIVQVDTSPGLRWITTGRTILNNKGNPVKQYEPFYSTTFEFESESQLVQIGFSPIFYYDALGRNIRTDRADGTFSSILFDTWQQQTWDENDTVLQSSWYSDQGSPDPLSSEPPDPQTRAAWLAAKHANTPFQSHVDSTGRVFYSIADNGTDGKYTAQSVLDIMDHLLAVVDSRNNTVMQYRYDVAGRPIYSHSMDGGERWVLPGVMDEPLYAWDSRHHQFRSVYDDLHRISQQWLTENTSSPAPEKLIVQNVYGENQPDDMTANLRGRLFQVYDLSGLMQTAAYDFKGNIKNSDKQLAADYKNVIDWNISNPASLLETETFSVSSLYDAINKLVEADLADGSKLFPVYDDGNLLRQLNGIIENQQTTVQFISNISYNAKSQREKILYGNNTATNYSYDEKTYRLTRLLTTRSKGADILQDLQYTYDPVGNVTQIQDNAQQTIFFNHAAANPGNKFEYDAIYRLISAYGREYAGSNSASDQFDTDKTQYSGARLLLKGDMNAMQQYKEFYQYDEVGNMLQMIHNAGNGVFQNKWTKVFSYYGTNNQLEKMLVGATTTNYAYDAHGNILNLQNGLFSITWNFADQLQKADLGGGGTAYYVYDRSGQRVRKVIENGSLVKDRLYLGGYEVYRERASGTLTLERETIHVQDGSQRIALVETRTKGTDAGLAFLVRYQYSNHLHTTCLEIDGNPDDPGIISYEEYYPFGNTAYQAARNQTDTAKRYRYTGKERDEESGLYYHGARYYISWLARWSTIDPAGFEDGMNLYAYVSNNPVRLYDPDGTDGNTPDQDKPAKPAATPANAKPSFVYSFPYSYQSWGSQLGKDSGKAAGFLWDATKKSPELNLLESNLLDPVLSQIKTDFREAWKSKQGKGAIITEGALFILPSAFLLAEWAYHNPQLNFPIVGNVSGRTVAVGALSLTSELISKELLHGKFALKGGYSEDDKTKKGTYSAKAEAKIGKLDITAGGSVGNKKSVNLGIKYKISSKTTVSSAFEFTHTSTSSKSSVKLTLDQTVTLGGSPIDVQVQGIIFSDPSNQSVSFNPKFNANDPARTVTSSITQPLLGSGAMITLGISLPSLSKKQKINHL